MKKVLSAALVLLLVLSGCAGAKQKTDYLILVNKENLLPEGYEETIELTEIEDVEEGLIDQIEVKTKEAYLELQAALLSEGIEIGIDSAYRSVAEQQEIMDEFTEKYGEDYAKAIVAVPGTSEHHTGLTIDVVPKVNGEWLIENEDMMKETKLFERIHAKITDYGFILRYPKGKEALTGYDYQPWVLRYVGKEAAKEITEQGICLEEYLAS